MENPEFTSPIPGEVDLLSDYYRIKSILKNDTVKPTDLEQQTSFDLNDFVHYYGSLESFYDTITSIEEKSKLITKDELVYEYLRILNEINKYRLTIYDIKSHSNFHFAIYLAKFGTWANVYMLMKEYVQKIKHISEITNKDFINDYYRIEKLLNKSPLSVLDYVKYGKYSEGTIMKRFGSWTLFLKSLNIRPIGDITIEDVKQDYYKVKAKLKKEHIFLRDYDKHGKYSDTMVWKRYGKWSEFLKAIGEDTSHLKEINRETLAKEYARVKELLGGRYVKQRELGKYSDFDRGTYTKYFGGWDKFLEYMGEESSKFTYTLKEMTDEYFRVKELLNKESIFYKDFSDNSHIKGHFYIDRFRTWKKFLEVIGENTDHLLPLSDEDFRNEYFRVKEKLNKEYITLKDMKDNAIIGIVLYKKRYGNWKTFLTECGENTKVIYYKETNSNQKEKKYTSYLNKITDEDLKDEYLRVKTLLKQSYISFALLIKNSKFSAKAYRNHFGTWDNFLKSIGEERPSKKIPEQDLIEEYWRVKKTSGKEMVSKNDMNAIGKYCSAVYTRRYGSWKLFKQKLGEKTDRIRIKHIDDVELKNEYVRVKKLLNKTKLKIEEINKFGKYSYPYYLKQYGSWNEFVKLMGDGYSRKRYTDQDLIEEYWRLKKELQKDYIDYTDMDKVGKFSSTTYSSRFGSWRKFLESLGENTEKPKIIIPKIVISEEELKNDYLRIKKLLNKQKLNQVDIRNHSKYYFNNYKNHFGSWDAFVRFMGDGNSRNLNTNQQIFDEYTRLKKKLNKDHITKTEWDKHSKYSSMICYWRFGSWIQFLKAMGESTKHLEPVPEEDLLNEYRRLQKYLNKTKITTEEMDKYGKYSYYIYHTHFGNWDDLVRKMGGEDSKYLYSDQELIDEYKRVKKEYNKDYISISEFSKKTKFCSSTYERRFGKWSKFLEMIGEDPKMYKKVRSEKKTKKE